MKIIFLNNYFYIYTLYILYIKSISIYIYQKIKSQKSQNFLKKNFFFQKVFEKALFFSLNPNFICLLLIVKLTFNFKMKAKYNLG